MTINSMTTDSYLELRRTIDVGKLFEDGYHNDSVQYNKVEISNKDEFVIERGINFSNDRNNFRLNSAIAVTSNEHLIKFHFSLEGSYAFKPLKHIDFKIQIPENHCNMFYIPPIKQGDIFFQSNTYAFEIYVKPEFLKTLLGNDVQLRFNSLNESIKSSNSYILWDKSKFIPPNIRSKINDIIQCPYKGAIRKKYLESKLTVLLIDFLLGRQTSRVSKSNVKLLNSDYLALVRVEDYIRKNLKEPLKIIDLADLAGFNSTKLKRDFKKLYGVTIFKYITALRMEVAMSLITQDGATIAHAAYEVGYANPQHFTTAFKRTMGYVPSELKPAVQ